MRILNPKISENLLQSIDLILKLNIVLCQLLPLLIVLIDLTLASLYHGIKIKNALLKTSEPLILQLFRLGQIISLNLYFIKLPAELLYSGILVLDYLRLI